MSASDINRGFSAGFGTWGSAMAILVKELGYAKSDRVGEQVQWAPRSRSKRQRLKIALIR